MIHATTRGSDNVLANLQGGGAHMIIRGVTGEITLKLSSTKSFLLSAACVHVMAIILASFTNR